MKGKILVVRYGGAVQMDHCEVSSSNDAHMSSYMLERLHKMGYSFVISNPSATFRRCVEENLENIAWYKDIELLDMPPVKVPIDVDFVYCLTGTENYRFGGALGIPAQQWIYRLLRDCKVPFIYAQCDANTPLWMPAELRHHLSASLGVSILELVKANITILNVGRDNEATQRMGYNTMQDALKYHVFSKDWISLMQPIIKEKGLPPSYNYRKGEIAFIGKNRSVGSKGSSMIEIGRVLDKHPDLGLSIHCYGSGWDKYVARLKKAGQDIPEAFVDHKPTRGFTTNLKIYNESEFGYMAHNDFNLEIRQITVRLYEILAGGTVPIIYRPWFNQWRDMFTDDIAEYIDQYLCFDDLNDIPKIVQNFRSAYSDASRTGIITNIRNSMNKIITNEYLNDQIEQMILKAFEPQTFNVSSMTVRILKDMYTNESNSKLRRVRDAAFANHEKRVHNTFNGGHQEISDEILPVIKEDWLFKGSPLSDQEVRFLFGR